MNIAFLSALLPVVLLLYFIYRQDKTHPEPIGKLLITFFVGCFSVVPALLLEECLSLAQPSPSSFPILSGIYGGYVVAGTSEELCKLLLLLLVIWRSPHFDEYFDGIIYATFLSLGFACVENIAYVIGGDDPISTALMRGLLSVPAHFLFAVTMGYYVSLAKFDPANRRKHLCRAFFYPMLLHGTYDAILMISTNLTSSTPNPGLINNGVCSVLFILFIAFDIRLWKWGIRRIKNMQRRSQEQDFNPSDPFSNFKWDI